MAATGFQGEAELVDLDLESGEGERVAAVLAVFFDDGAEFGAPVEGRAADAGGEQVPTGVFDTNGGFVGHGVSVWFTPRARTARRWPRQPNTEPPRQVHRPRW